MGRKRKYFTAEERNLARKKCYQNHKKERKKYDKEYYQTHKEEILKKKQKYHKHHKEKEKIKKKEYYQTHKRKIKVNQTEYQKKHKEKIKLYKKEYYQNNKEKIKIYQKEQYRNNKDKAKDSQKRWRKNHKKEINEYVNNKLKTNIEFKIACYLRTRLRIAIHNNQKIGSAIQNLGCSISELKSYLENKFQEGMTWDNYSYRGWHIDHIIPLSSFNLSNREDFLKACHYTNLQPMWAKENMKKGNKQNNK